MGLQGLTITTWAGWLTGVIFLQRPWGQPQFISYLSGISTFIAIFNSAVRSFMIIDAFFHFQDVYLQALVSKEELRTLLNQSAFWEISISSAFLQLLFLLNAKKLALLWGHLYQRNMEDAKRSKIFYGILQQSFIAGISLLSMLVNGIFQAIPAAKNYQKSWLSPIGQVAFSIIGYSYFVGPAILPAHYGLTTVLTTLYHLECVYDKYCSKLHGMMMRTLFENVEMGKQSQHVTNNQKRKPNSMMMTWKKSMGTEEKVKMVHEFQEIQYLFTLSECTVSPIILVILTGASFRLVINAAKIFYREQEEFLENSFIIDCCQIVHVACQMCILQIGQRILDKVW